MAEKEKPIAITCPNCDKVLCNLSMEMLRQAEVVEVRCDLCGHYEIYKYEGGKVTVTCGEE